MDERMRSRDSVEMSPCDELVDRTNSMTTASAQSFRNNNIIDHGGDQEAQRRGDAEYVASLVSSSTTVQCSRDLVLSGTKREAKPNRRQRHVFDDLTKANLNNTGLSHPGRSEMRFGDLDFNFDISGEWVEDEKVATESLSILSELLNEAAAS